MFDRRTNASWKTLFNRASSGEAEIIYDEESQTGFMKLDFTMHEGDGLHAQISRFRSMDLSDFGGISFRARGTGIDQAHLSLFDKPHTDDQIFRQASNRINAYFPVSSEWQEYHIPFTMNHFEPDRLHMSDGASGIFLFHRVDGMVFEVWGYHGKGELHIDDVKLLPAEAEQQLTSRLVVENFEEENASSSVFDQQMHRGGGATGRFETVSGTGALGTEHFTRIHASRQHGEHAELGFHGTLLGMEYDGLGFSIRSPDLPVYRFQAHQIAPGIMPAGHIPRNGWESLVPVNDQWVEWRFPFDSHALRFSGTQSNAFGRFDGHFLDSISFQFPHEVSGRNTVTDIDELLLYNDRSDQQRRVGLFHAVCTDDSGSQQVENIIHSVMQYNLGRIEEYTLASDLRAATQAEAVTVAEENGSDFFLLPHYRISQGELYLHIDVISTTAQTALHRLHDQAPIDIDIFGELDKLSVESINAIADTNLDFRDFTEWVDSSWVWSDPLDRQQAYWLEYSGTALRVPGRQLYLTEAYVNGVQSISFELSDAEQATDLFWNYRGVDSHNRLTIKRQRALISINQTADQEFVLPDADDAPLQVHIHRAADDRYIIRINGQQVGEARGPDLAFGRFGFGRGFNTLQNLEVSYTGTH